uniref:Uncharacterized protein n=1 Tax=Zea mays TaxID=4577 RepID=C4J2E8_MAIZE|nr:unknown [Zea mays]
MFFTLSRHLQNCPSYQEYFKQQLQKSWAVQLVHQQVASKNFPLN